MQICPFMEFIPKQQMRRFHLMKGCKFCRWKRNGYNNELNINNFAFLQSQYLKFRLFANDSFYRVGEVVLR